MSVDAFVGERAQVDAHLLNRHAPFLAGAEHLLDQVHQPVAVLQHHVVELAPLRFVDRRSARLQRLEVQADRRDRRLQLVRHGVDERVVLLVAPDFADEKGGVEDQAGDDGGEDQAAEQQRDELAQVRTTQPTLSATASATRHTQNVTKKAMAPWRPGATDTGT